MAESGASKGLPLIGREAFKCKCLKLLKARLGPETFTLVASHAPMTFQPALSRNELQSVETRIRTNIESIGQEHWLKRYIDRPSHSSLKVSALSLAEAVRRLNTRQTRLDVDAIYVLFMLRSFSTAWASFPEGDSDILEEWDSDFDETEHGLSDTPLCEAVCVNATTVVRLFLAHGANPNGYQSRSFDHEDGEEWQKATPLFVAITRGSSSSVDLLLRSRADPNEWGMIMELSGEAVHPDGCNHHDHETPLWQAVRNACDQSPESPGGKTMRSIVRLLVLHGARSDWKGKFEYFSGGGPFPDDSEYYVDSDGDRHSSDSETTPLEAALKRKNAMSDPDFPIQYLRAMPDAKWSDDVISILNGDIGASSQQRCHQQPLEVDAPMPGDRARLPVLELQVHGIQARGRSSVCVRRRLRTKTSQLPQPPL